MKKLTWVNGEHIKRLPFEEYFALALPILREAVKTPGIDYRKLAEMTQSRVNFIKDCAELVDFVDALPDYETALYTHKKMKTTPEIAKRGLELAVSLFEPLADWRNDRLFETASAGAEAAGMARSQILWPVRTALSGKPASPCGATELCELLGKEETLLRLRIGVTKISG
jgi:glutamyl-tRNA synthetase